MNRLVPEDPIASQSVAGGPVAIAAERMGPLVLRHALDLLRLAWPVMLSRAGILVMAFVDIAMLGRYGLGAPGVAGLGLAIFVPVMVVAIGLVSGMMPVVARAHGAGERQECGRAWRRAVSWGTFVSLIGVWLVWQGETMLGWLDYPADIASAGGAVSRALAPGLLAQVLFAACAFYLEATRRPLFALAAMVIANLVNLALNWVMIFGHLGLPEMGAVGAALASTLARFAALGLMVWFILRQSDPRGAGVTGPWQTVWGPGGWRAGRPMRRLGMSAGLSNGFETIGFAAMMMIAGTLGTAALDAYSISHNLVSTVFMVGLGLSVATGVRVGLAAGAGDAREAAVAGWTGLVVALAVMGCIAVLVLAFRHQIVLAYTDVPELGARAAGVMLFSAFIFVPDSAQVVLGQAVRALGDAWVPVAGLCRQLRRPDGAARPVAHRAGRLGRARPGRRDRRRVPARHRSARLALPRSDAPSRMSESYRQSRIRWSVRAGEWLVYALAWIFRLLTWSVPTWALSGFFAPLGGMLAVAVPRYRRRAEENLALVWPDRAPAERRRIVRAAGAQFTRLMVEYTQLDKLPYRQELRITGAEHLLAARDAGRGAVLVTAHYGNWEAARLAARRLGCETGIIYRAFNNLYCDRYALDFIACMGGPVLQKSKRGMRDLAAHVGQGGFVMILVDQRNTGAPFIDFLGRPAETSTAAAHVALRTGAALIPVRAARNVAARRFDVAFEAPVTGDDWLAMMAEVNRRFGAWIEAAPEQWLWFHRRWRSTFRSRRRAERES